MPLKGVNATVAVYWLVKELTSKDNAQAVSENSGGQLASIKTSDENSYILQSVLEECDDNVWTGGTGIGGKANTFVWPDGSFVENGFTYWYGGQPYYPTPNKPLCLSLTHEWNFRWNDNECYKEAYGLCSFI